MSEIKVIGDDAFETVGGTVQVGMNGIEAATAKFLLSGESYDLESGSQWAIDQLGESHGEYDWLKCVNINVVNNGPFIEATFNYRGIQDTSGTSLSVSAAVSTEPIDSHPNFEQIGGTAEEPINGAMFNDDDTFKAFEISQDCPREEDDNKQGVKSYLSPSIVVEVTEYIDEGERLQLDNVGKRESQSGLPKHDPAGGITGGKPSFPKRDWLNVGESLEPIGKQMIRKTKYRLSGLSGNDKDNKWNEDIYDK